MQTEVQTEAQIEADAIDADAVNTQPNFVMGPDHKQMHEAKLKREEGLAFVHKVFSSTPNIMTRIRMELCDGSETMINGEIYPAMAFYKAIEFLNNRIESRLYDVVWFLELYARDIHIDNVITVFISFFVRMPQKSCKEFRNFVNKFGAQAAISMVKN